MGLFIFFLTVFEIVFGSISLLNLAPVFSLAAAQGNVVWRRLEARRVCGGSRTWQSMKEQFRKVQQGMEILDFIYLFIYFILLFILS